MSELWNANPRGRSLPEMCGRCSKQRRHGHRRWAYRQLRFHSFQCIFFAVAWTVLWIALSFVGHIPFLGWATILLWPLISLAGLIIWVILVLKAYQGQTFKLPVIGDRAEKQANTV